MAIWNGTPGNDTYAGGAGDDQVSGGGGNDTLNGNDGNDRLMGENGDDVLDGGVGNDTLYGDSVTSSANIGGSDQVHGGFGDDSIFGGYANDTLHGDDGNDWIFGGGAIFGDAGNDYLISFGSDAGQTAVSGGLGDDTLTIKGYVHDGSVRLNGDDGNDVLVGGDGNDTMDGGAGNDSLDGDVGDDALAGGLGNDTLNGSWGNDRIYGGAGKDIITGGFGDDTIDAGASPDAIIYDARGFGADTVLNFSVAEDKIDLRALHVADFASLMPFISQVGADTVIALGYNSQAEQITLSAIDSSTLTAGNFLFDITGRTVHATGSGGADVLFGTAGNDTLEGYGGNDSLAGGAGNDSLDGGTGTDTIYGGLGDDSYWVDEVIDSVVEAPGEGRDTIVSTAGFYVLPENVEVLKLIFAADGFGNAGDNEISGSYGADRLYGVDGNDTLSDSPDGDSTDDLLDGGAGDDVLSVTGGVNTLVGGAGDDILKMRYGTAIFDGGDGRDLIMLGQYGGQVILDLAVTGEQTMGADHITLTGIESVQSGTGFDRITGDSHSNSLWGGGGNDTLDGAGGGDSLYGQDGNDVLVGHGGDTLDGGNGEDRLTGRAGDTLMGGEGGDTYVVDQAGMVIVEVQHPSGYIGLSDAVETSIDNYGLGEDIEVLTLTGTAVRGNGNAANNWLWGNGQANTLRGLDGNDFLNGYAGADALYGGQGNDTYVVDGQDRVFEYADQGVDELRVLGTSFRLAAGLSIEYLLLYGIGDDRAIGNELDNFIATGSGNDRLDGGLGADILHGGFGDDTYYVDNAGDVVNELARATYHDDFGTDTIISTISYTLRDTDYEEVENLVLRGTADLTATGNALANRLIGNDGDNLLDGGAGADSLAGGAGDDTYYLDDAGDKVGELEGGGHDTVYSSVTHGLRPNVEDLVLTGTADIAGAGNALDNAIAGNAGANRLNGLGGNDTLTGGAGADTFIFGLGSGADTIADFDSAEGDLIHLRAYSNKVAYGGGVTITQSGADVLIDMGGGNTVTVPATQKADLSGYIIW